MTTDFAGSTVNPFAVARQCTILGNVDDKEFADLGMSTDKVPRGNRLNRNDAFLYRRLNDVNGYTSGCLESMKQAVEKHY